jgi:phenylalanyl-tRNA synthetase alpha chain
LELLGDEAVVVQEVAVLAETATTSLPRRPDGGWAARPGQKNVRLRVVLSDMERTPTSAEAEAKAKAKAIRDRIYAQLHEGGAYEWAADHAMARRRVLS